MEFALDAPQSNGGTLRDHLLAAKKSRRLDPPQLKVPPPPPELHLVLPAFRHLSARRRYEQGQPLPILDTEVEAFCRLRGIALRPQDLDALERLDGAWLTAMRAPDGGAAEDGEG